LKVQGNIQRALNGFLSSSISDVDLYLSKNIPNFLVILAIWSRFMKNNRDRRIMKIFWFDVETTGLDARKNDIVQLAYQLEIDGEIVKSSDLKFRPINVNAIEEKALEVNGLTVDEIMQYPDAKEQYCNLVNELSQYIDKYDRNDKAYPAGYNVNFDYNFLMAFPYKVGDKYGFGSFLNHALIDPLPIINNLLAFNAISPAENRKLETMCSIFGIDINAHDAASDINATRELYYKLMCRFSFDGQDYWKR